MVRTGTSQISVDQHGETVLQIREAQKHRIRIRNTAGSIGLNAILFRFKTKEAAEEFKSKFETCQKEIPEKKPTAATVSLLLRIGIRGSFLLLNIFLPFCLFSYHNYSRFTSVFLSFYLKIERSGSVVEPEP